MGRRKAALAVNTNDVVAELVNRGREQGFITQDDVLAVFPYAESHF